MARAGMENAFVLLDTQSVWTSDRKLFLSRVRATYFPSPLALIIFNIGLD